MTCVFHIARDGRGRVYFTDSRDGAQPPCCSPLGTGRSRGQQGSNGKLCAKGCLCLKLRTGSAGHRAHGRWPFVGTRLTQGWTRPQPTVFNGLRVIPFLELPTGTGLWGSERKGRVEQGLAPGGGDWRGCMYGAGTTPSQRSWDRLELSTASRSGGPECHGLQSPC